MTDADVCPMRTARSSIRRKLGDNTESHACTFTQLRVGYRMPKGETPGQEEAWGLDSSGSFST